MSDELLTHLAALDSCVVSDALDRLQLRGTVHGIGRLWACPRVVGRVVTVQLGPFDAEAAAAAPHLGTRAIEAAGDEHVIVVANAGARGDGGLGRAALPGGAPAGVRGVVFVGAGSATEVLATAEQLAAREAELAAQIERGVPPTQVLGGGYERMTRG